MKHLEWYIDKKFKIFDFSKGEFDYKKRWGNMEYNFEYHILYDSSSLKSKLISLFISKYFDLKQFLREKNIHTFFHKVIFLLKGNKKRKGNVKNFEITPVKSIENEGSLSEININDEEYSFLKRHIYDFLYKYSENIKGIKVYTIAKSAKSFVIVGISNYQKIVFKTTQ